MDTRSKIIVILGPTSSGKSDIAIKLAKKFNGEIISADSRQVYRWLDIGTGKIEADHSAEIPKEFTDSKFSSGPRGIKPYFSDGIAHHLIDNVSPRTNYNAAKFKKDAEKTIKDILKRNKLPIICGGTGFWIKAIVDDVNYPEVKPDWVLRQHLRNKTAEELFSILQKLDPRRAKNIDAKNKVRLIRAIEICRTLGKVPRLNCHPEPVSGSQGMPKQVRHDKSYDFLQIGIVLPKEKLHQNIEKRLKKRFVQGMIKEVENLHKKHKLSWKKIESFGLGYFWIPKLLKGEIESEEELFEKVYQTEKDYASRQMTWFKKDSRIRWLSDYQNIGKAVKSFLS